MALGGRDGREDYHHGNLREALIQAALGAIAQRGLAGLAIAELARAVGVSSAAPYRHFRDRDALIAEVARRGFEQLTVDLQAARAAGGSPVAALERCAQAHLAFAAREPAAYTAMSAAVLPADQHKELTRAREATFAVLRRAAQAACDNWGGRGRPPAQMVALHVWSLTHGIVDLFVTHGADNSRFLPMSAEELLEAGLLVYLRSLDLSG